MFLVFGANLGRRNVTKMLSGKFGAISETLVMFYCYTDDESPKFDEHGALNG